VQQLLNDVGDNPDQLPILQHALMRTWDHWSRHQRNGEPIDLDHYDRFGGMSRALSLHADEAYEELAGERSKKIAEKLFKTLSERGPDNREIRRPTKLGRICAIAEANEKEVIAVIDTYRRQGRSFLMPPPDVALTPDTLIDVSHESLIRNWELLKKWVAEEAQSAQIYRRLAETAVLYREGKAGYWRDPDLQIALSWREQAGPNEAWAQLYHPEFDSAMKFLDDSRANREAEMAQTEAARERELRQAQALAAEQSKAAKRLRLALALLTILLLAGIFAVVTFTQRQIAVKEAATAETEKQRAEQEKVKADSTATAFAALFQEADSLQRIAAGAAEAEKGARLEAEQQRELAIVARDSAGIAREQAQTQAALAEARKNEALKSQRQVQAVALAINAQRLQQQGNDTLSALLALESYRLDELSGGQFRNETYNALRKSLNALSAKRGGPAILPAPTELMSAMDFSPAGNKLAIGGADSTVQLLELDQPSRFRLLGKHRGVVNAVAFSPDGRFLASGGADYAIMVWRLREGSKDATILRGHEDRISSLAFSPDGNGLASGSMDGAVRWWDLQNANQGRVLGKHKGSVTSIAFAPATAPALFATAGADKRVLVGNFQDKISLIVLDTLHFAAAPRALAFSPKGDLLAVGCEDGATRLVWLRRGEMQTLRGHQKRVNAVAFSPSGNLLAAGSSDKTIRLWNLQQLAVDPIVLSEHGASIRSMAFTATGDTLIAGTFGKEIVLWLTSAADLAERVRNQVQRNLTLEEWREFVGAESEYPYGKK
jgi:WD40 repeat protein